MLTTIKHYRELFAGAFLIKTVQKYTGAYSTDPGH
jgi:hypothetical protein